MSETAAPYVTISEPGDDAAWAKWVADMPSTPSKTPALDYMREEGFRDDVIDLLYDLLVARGMTRDEVDAALNTACGEWLTDQQDEWWM